MRALAVSIASILALAPIAAGQSEAVGEGTSKRLDTSWLDDFRGPLKTVVGPSGALFLGRRPGWSSYFVTASGRFDAVGFLASDSSFVGIARMTPLNDRFEVSVLRLRLKSPDSLEASLHDMSGHLLSSEIWSRDPVTNRPPIYSDYPALPPPPKMDKVDHGPDYLPKFGEDVWADELPEAIYKVLPEQRGDGVVMVQALVGSDGLVKDTRIVKSIPELNSFAIKAVREWRFKPAMTNGHPIAVWVAVPVRFTR
jgi:TonB family protein